MLQQKEFLKKYNITDPEFAQTALDWKMLNEIFDNYQKIKADYETTARGIVERLIWAENVHSVKSRIKDPERLIAKIIRNKLKHPEREFTVENYTDIIDDIIGIRILHLYDWNLKFPRKTMAP